MKVGSCFAGIGGIDLGLEVHGMTTVWHSEISIYRKSRRPAHSGDGESWVLTDYTNDQGRPRILTPEEWETAHGFPPGWTVAAGSDNARWETLGNAVSPPVAERVGRGIALVEGLETEEDGDPYATPES